EIQKLRAPEVEQAWPGEVVARGDDFVRRLRVGEIPRLIDQNDPAGHGDNPVTPSGKRSPRARLIATVRTGGAGACTEEARSVWPEINRRGGITREDHGMNHTRAKARGLQ